MTKVVNGDTFSDLTTSVNPGSMNYGTDRLPITQIVIHHNATTNKDVAMNTWLKSAGKETSAHYEITPTEIIGCVGEDKVAWHAGDHAVNQRSIGLEHVNETGAPSWTVSRETMEQSAKLIADIAKRYGFEPNAQTVIPHREVVSTACPGGLDVTQLIDMARQVYFNGSVQTEPVVEMPKSVSANEHFRATGGRFSISKSFRVLEVKFYAGIWQARLEGITLEPFDWEHNGVPFQCIDNDNGGLNVQTGDMVHFIAPYNSGTIDEYSDNLGAAKVDMFVANGTTYSIWFNSQELLDA